MLIWGSWRLLLSFCGGVGMAVFFIVQEPDQLLEVLDVAWYELDELGKHGLNKQDYQDNLVVHIEIKIGALFSKI